MSCIANPMWGGEVVLGMPNGALWAFAVLLPVIAAALGLACLILHENGDNAAIVGVISSVFAPVAAYCTFMLDTELISRIGSDPTATGIGIIAQIVAMGFGLVMGLIATFDN
ncbi:MAG TPA: hypothetical protein VLA77_02170 [Candidatus Saccharimonadales bacterium]|nr:hypothetical protein [Candidatus Saccharimonadales bacterium]